MLQTHFKDEHISPPAVCISGCETGSSDEKNWRKFAAARGWARPEVHSAQLINAKRLKRKVGPYHLQMWFYSL